jgi:DNA-binding XRE family transcriptional regulator
MNAIQFIERDGQREYAIVPIELFNRLAEYSEDMEDVALYDAAVARDDGFRVPGEVAHAILNGDSPVKAWRSHRAMTQDELAAQAGISKAYLCQIETGKREGAVKTLKALAKALGVSMDDLK